MAGQPQVGSNPVLTFDVNDILIRETTPAGFLGQPGTIIPATSGFAADVSFVLDGILATFVAGTKASYSVTLSAESLGAGFEGQIGPTFVGALVPGQLQYGPAFPAPVPTVAVPAGTLPVGVYKLVAVVTFTGPVPPPIVGFIEGPVLQII